MIKKYKCIGLGPREIATGDKVLALGCENGSLVLVDVRARRILTTITGTSSINALGILEDLKLIVCREDGTITLYQLGKNEPQLIRTWHESNSPIRSLLVSPKVSLNIIYSFLRRKILDSKYYLF